MIRLSQDRHRTLLAIHGGSAVLLGLLLYAVIVTGVASVFADELADWSSPLAGRVDDSFAPGTDRAIRTLAAGVDPQFHEELFFFPRAGGRLYAFFHTHEFDEDGRPRERGVAAEFDPRDGTLIERRAGTDAEIDAGDSANALADFMVDLHVRLHLPDPWGLLLTGILGLAMLVAAVTGLAIHRHLIRELFTLRRHGQPLLKSRDAHVVAGTWNLPFALTLAFTGSYFSFASAFAIPAMAAVVFGGDQQKLFDTIVGTPTAENAAPAAVADLDAMIADVRARSGADLSFVQIQHWGRADARVTMFLQDPAGALTAPNYVYDGATGAFLHVKPRLGLQPSAGDTLFQLMAPLHFGHFAGLFSKALWFALGFAAAHVSITGLLLWTRRRADRPGWRALARATHGVGYGLPLALSVAAGAYFPARAAGTDVQFTMMALFLVAAAAATLVSAGASLTDSRRWLLGATGAALAALPALRILCGGPGWNAASAQGLHMVMAVDLAMLAGGLGCALALRRGDASAPRPGSATEPAA